MVPPAAREYGSGWPRIRSTLPRPIDRVSSPDRRNRSKPAGREGRRRAETLSGAVFERRPSTICSVSITPRPGVRTAALLVARCLSADDPRTPISSLCNSATEQFHRGLVDFVAVTTPPLTGRTASTVSKRRKRRRCRAEGVDAWYAVRLDGAKPAPNASNEPPVSAASSDEVSVTGRPRRRTAGHILSPDEALVSGSGRTDRR